MYNKIAFIKLLIWLDMTGFFISYACTWFFKTTVRSTVRAIFFSMKRRIKISHMLQEQSSPFNPFVNIETIIPSTHYLSRSSLCSKQHWAYKATRPQMFSLSVSEKSLCSRAGAWWNSSSKRNKGRGKSVIEDRGKKGHCHWPSSMPHGEDPTYPFPDFFWVNRYGTPILQCKDYVTLSCAASAWGIKKSGK